MTHKAQRLLRPLGTGVAVVAVAASGAVVAPTVAAGAGTVDDLNVTLRLELEEVEVVSFDPDDDEEEFVRFEFEERVDDIVDESGFALVGLAADEEVRAVHAQRHRGDPSQVIVAFESGTDVRSFTLGTVDGGTVVDVDHEGNPPDSLPLRGSRADFDQGLTTGPDLIGVRRQSAIQRLVFAFDENLDEDGVAEPRDFGFYTESGRVHRGDAVVSADDHTVTIAFSERGGDQVDEAVRAFVLRGAVSDDQGNANPYGARGGDTVRPDLEDVDAQADGIVWEFAFDDDIASADARRFRLVTARGTTIAADTVSRGSDDSVLAVFEDAADFAGDVVLAVALPGAVDAARSLRSSNTLGVEPIDVERGDGPTIGPDLEDVAVDDDSGLVSFRFDEDLDLDDTIDATDFAVITRSGHLERGRTVSESDDDSVIVVFGTSAVRAAVAFTVAPDAVRDDVGNGNPLRTITE